MEANVVASVPSTTNRLIVGKDDPLFERMLDRIGLICAQPVQVKRSWTFDAISLSEGECAACFYADTGVPPTVIRDGDEAIIVADITIMDADCWDRKEFERFKGKGAEYTLIARYPDDKTDSTLLFDTPEALDGSKARVFFLDTDAAMAAYDYLSEVGYTNVEYNPIASRANARPLKNPWLLPHRERIASEEEFMKEANNYLTVVWARVTPM